MGKRQTKYWSYALLYTLVVIAVLAGINWLANRHNKSVDTTSNKRYSLSEQTLKVVSGLQKDVKITYFDQAVSFPQARDLLGRYDNLSTKLTVDYVDPNKKPQLAKDMGIRQMGAIVVESGDRRQDARSLSEEEITSALVRVLKGGERTACFLTGAGEHGLDDSGRQGYSQVKTLLEGNNYKTQTVSLLEKPEVPKECTLVVVGGPRYDYPQPVVDALKAAVEGGGRALFLLDAPLQLQKTKIATNEVMVKMLADWGVTPVADLVLDPSPVGGLFGLGPEMPLSFGTGQHPISRDMKDAAAAMPFTRSLDVKPTDKTSAEKLMQTSERSAATTNLSAAAIELNPEKDAKGPLTVAAAGDYRTGQPNSSGRFVVTGSSDWVANYALRFGSNRDLFLNMVNWLTNDEDLISIRPKEPEDRRLQLSRSQMNLMQISSLVLIPLSMVALGVMVWWRRR